MIINKHVPTLPQVRPHTSAGWGPRREVTAKTGPGVPVVHTASVEANTYPHALIGAIVGVSLLVCLLITIILAICYYRYVFGLILTP